jgi:DnaJ like chaperone protein
MTNPEFWVVVPALLLGYWLVSNFLSGNKNKDARQNFEKAFGQDIDEEFSKAGNADWAALLGISPGASVDEIRKAYKSQMSQYHPDKVAALGIELKELAERKSKEINIAYKRAMKDRQVEEQFW